MERERNRLQLGDISRAQFEADKFQRVAVSSLQKGDECIMRFMMPPVAGADYVSDYPIRIDGVRDDSEHIGGKIVSVSHLQPRSEEWEKGPLDVHLSEDSLIQLRNIAQRGWHSRKPVPEWPKDLMDMGYFLMNEDIGAAE